MKIATWNIGGGHTMRSLATFDYHESIDTAYFIEKLRSVDCDVVCLQESQCSSDYSVAKEIAKGLDMPYVFESPMSPSHIDEQYKLSIAIISKTPIENDRAIPLPYPNFELSLPDGNRPVKHDKYLQLVEINGITIANTHTQPLGYLGHEYDSELGMQYIASLRSFYRTHLASESTLIFAGDFNMADPIKFFEPLWSELKLHDALPNIPTKLHVDWHLDCIFTSLDFDVIESNVMKTNSDHYLGWVSLSESQSI